MKFIKKKTLAILSIARGKKSLAFSHKDTFWKIRTFPANQAIADNPQQMIMESEGWKGLNKVNEVCVYSGRFLSVTKSDQVKGKLLHYQKDRAVDFFREFVSLFEPCTTHRISLADIFKHKFGEEYIRILTACPIETGAMLGVVNAPLTGAHGDLSCKNIMIDGDGRFYVIDWEMATLNSSYAVDAVRLLASSMKINSSAPNDIFSICKNKRLSTVIECVPASIFFPVYIIERAHVELFVRGDPIQKVLSAIHSRFSALERNNVNVKHPDNGPNINLDDLILKLSRRTAL